MDDLDRLYIELVEVLRREESGGLDEPLSVAEIHERLVPYRRVRDLVGFRSNDDYEATLSRLLAGDREYVLGEAELQSRLRSALEEPLPDIRCFRSFRESRVRLNPEKIPPPGNFRYAPPEVREQAESVAPTGVESAEPEAEPESAATGPAVEREEPTEDPDTVAPADHSLAEPPSASSDAETPSGSRPEAGLIEGSPPSMEQEMVDDRASGPGSCPDCGERPPDNAAFCPYCGRKLGAASCRECGAELERDWAYCPGCGASVERGRNPA